MMSGPVLIYSLPNGIIIRILQLHDTVTNAYSTARSCRGLYEVFRLNARSILRTIFDRNCDNTQGVGPLSSVLIFALRHNFIPVDEVEVMLTRAWPMFSERRLEVLLLFIVMAI